jgi:hypothetical protein
LEEWGRPQETGWRAWESTPAGQRVSRIVNATRTEASELRYEAEEEARARLRAAESDAERYLEEARQSAEELVLSRMRRLAELSAEIDQRYRRIVQGLDRAAAAGADARLLVDSLGRAAERLRHEAGRPVEPTPIRRRRTGLAADPSIDGVQ